MQSATSLLSSAESCSSQAVAECIDRAADDAQIASIVASLDSINKQLESADPFQIVEWAIDNLPGLYQTTAFGVTGCVSLDQISRISETRAKNTGQVSISCV